MNEGTTLTQLGREVVLTRGAERDARIKAERLEREAALATNSWQIAKKRRERAELWLRAEQLRQELVKVENAAANITA